MLLGVTRSTAPVEVFQVKTEYEDAELLGDENN